MPMKCLLLIAVILHSALLYGESTRIHSFAHSFVKFENGEVAFLDNLDPSEFRNIEQGDLVEYQVGDDQSLIQLNKLDEIASLKETDHSSSESFEPSLISNYKIATNLLLTFPNDDLEGSQCYDRAHTWAYRSESKNGVKLSKAWLFFADHYIETYRFKWWFHVAPFAKILMKGVVEERIMDRKFYAYPLKFKLWTDIFMENKVECREIELYTDYSRSPNTDDCFILRSTPYYWQPRDLKSLAEKGREKTQYIDWEVDYAYSHAYGMDRNQ